MRTAITVERKPQTCSGTAPRRDTHARLQLSAPDRNVAFEVFGSDNALHIAQLGQKHPDAKPLKGFGGAGVLEVVEDNDGNTYRAVYTVKLAGYVYALHAFQKKSRKGIKTSAADLEKVKVRLKIAEEDHATRLANEQQEASDEDKD